VTEKYKMTQGRFDEAGQGGLEADRLGFSTLIRQ
jgi:hypothetical protein